MIDRAAAQITGRRGADLQVAVQGTDPDQDATSIVLRILDSLGQPVDFRDTDLDGRPDSNELTLPFEPTVDGASFFGTAARAKLLVEVPSAKAVVVVVRDSAGGTSSSLRAELQAQPEHPVGAPCDPTYVTSRCALGAACRGDPAVCVEGVAPVLTRLAYVQEGRGARILALGTDLDDDITQLHLEFMDAAGSPTAVDLDGDDIPESNAFDLAASGASEGGTFFVSLSTGEGFHKLVPRISVKVMDEGHRSSAPLDARVAAPVVRERGRSCDPRGFDRCAEGLVCWSKLPTAPATCQDPAALRSLSCSSAEVLDPSQGEAEFVGIAAGVSLWDAPRDCAAHDPVGRPEGVVRLHLAAPARELVLSTQHPETEFDTVLYLVGGGCGITAGPSLGCVDDASHSLGSELVLEDVPSGDYVVVVDAWSEHAGRFKISARVR